MANLFIKDGAERITPDAFMPYSLRREMTEEEAQADYERRLQNAINAMTIYTARHNASLKPNG